MKTIKITSILLGIISLSFGLLKFISPFKDWYHAQVLISGMPAFAVPLGILGEIAVGIAYISSFTFSAGFAKSRILLVAASIVFILMMIAATIVHLMPEVPADVLPMKIKPPFIPLAFLVVASINLRNIVKIRGTV